jgi:hypothetical protein
MKTVRKTFLFTALASILITQSGCFGSFNLTKKVYDWNDSAVNDKFLKSLLFLGLCIVPVYEISLLVDAVVFNLIEFWSGSNPVAMEEGESEMQLVTFNGNDYRIVATKDTFTTTQMSGTQAGEVRVLKFDRQSRTWNYSDSWTKDTPVMTFLDDHAENVRLYTANGYSDLARADMQDEKRMAGLLGACLDEAYASVR